MRYPILIFVIAFFARAHTARAQPFVVSPATSVSFEVSANLANECWIFFENSTNADLHLKWRLVQQELPAGWNIDLCDYGACYTGIPPHGQMNDLPPGPPAYLKLIVQPGDVSGEGFVRFLVYDTAAPEAFVEVTFSLSSAQVSATTPVLPETRVSPNPFSASIFIETPNSALPVSVYDGTGKPIFYGLPGTNGTISTAPWPNGIYYLFINHSTQPVTLLKAD